MRLSGGGTQGEAGGCLGGDDANVRGVVFESGNVASELVLECGVGIENGGQPMTERLAGQRGEIRPEGIAHALELMTCATRGLEQRCTPFGVGLQFGEVGVAGDDLGPIGGGSTKKLGRACG